MQNIEKNNSNYCPPLIGNSREMRKTRELISAAAKMRLNMLVIGESGTGRDAVVQNLYCRSSRNDKPFIKFNCATLTKGLLENEMILSKTDHGSYGRQKKHGKSGLGGCQTIFLDQINALSLPLQEKLLHFLHHKRYMPGDDDTDAHTDTWFIAAADQDLENNVANGLFREDLYRLISKVKINLPPLRKRPEDIPLIVEYYMKQTLSGRVWATGPETNPFLLLGPQMMKKFAGYHWPGNVKELRECLKNEYKSNIH